MKTNCSITLYNKFTNKTTTKEEYKKTVIKRAMWQNKQLAAVSTTESGKGALNSADIFNIYIPLSNNDFGNKKYIEPNAWNKLSDADKDKYFTFQKLDFAVKGECSFEFNAITNPITNLSKNFDNVCSIMSTKVNDFGSSALSHYEIGGK
jgi:hypothetical protein